MLHNPVEELGVDMFRESIASVGGLKAREGLDISLCGRLQLSVAQPLGHIRVAHTHQLAERRQMAIVRLWEKKEMYYFTTQQKVNIQVRI